MKLNQMKAAFVTAFTALTAWLGLLAVPLYILVGLNAVDYATGLCAAKYRDEAISSYKGLRGIAKKICMWLLVAVGAAIDWLVMYAANTIGVPMAFTYIVACMAAVWLICNELISILENIADIGVKLPPFLMKIVVLMKKAVEEKTELEDKDHDAQRD